jgi:hypothetical protein
MNYSTAVFLINSDVRAVICTYEADEAHKKAPRQMFKTFDKSIAVGDLVTVPSGTRHLVTVCKVVEVDADVDFDNSSSVDWIIGKIDMTAHKLTLTQEEDAIRVIQSAEKTKKRNELRAAMLADSNEALKALPITVSSELSAPASE